MFTANVVMTLSEFKNIPTYSMNLFQMKFM